MSVINHLHRGALALFLVFTACGDDAPKTECGAGTSLVNGACVTDAMCGSGTTLSNGECVSDSTCGTGTVLMAGMCVPVATTTSYRQIEFLGRPGIGEALLITPGYLNAYNAVAPSFTGASAADVAAVGGEVKTVLKALYLGACLLNGLVSFDGTTGVHPGGTVCVQSGGNIFTNDNALTGTTLDTNVAAAASAYADRVYSQFETDALRINTAVPSGYLTPCSSTLATGIPLLCGGRLLNDDVIDVTYFYLLAGAMVPTGTTGNPLALAQTIALVSDGVFFSGTPGENSNALGTPNTSNPNQFKQSCPNCGPTTIGTTFPYSAPPR